jgi:NAD(P)-dependent dehydrogenase (short-subunit alcohol dehydrogenase family)
MIDTPLPPAKPLDAARALIVGGTSGVGLEIARQLLAAGAPGVAIAGRDAGRGARALATLGEPAALHFVAGDATTPNGATGIARAATEVLGGIDILVCCTAPAVLPELFFRTPVEAIAPTLTQLALPPMFMAAAVLPHMRAQRGGVIVNIASDAAKSATPGEAVIGGGMAAIVMFSRTIAMEVKRDGIRVNILTPSLISGTETSARILDGGFSAKLFSKAAAMASLGVADAGDVAAMAVYLASPAARRVTGQAISVNGGISAA